MMFSWSSRSVRLCAGRAGIGGVQEEQEEQQEQHEQEEQEEQMEGKERKEEEERSSIFHIVRLLFRAVVAKVRLRVAPCAFSSRAKKQVGMSRSLSNPRLWPACGLVCFFAFNVSHARSLKYIC